MRFVSVTAVMSAAAILLTTDPRLTAAHEPPECRPCFDRVNDIAQQQAQSLMSVHDAFNATAIIHAPRPEGSRPRISPT